MADAGRGQVLSNTACQCPLVEDAHWVWEVPVNIRYKDS